MVNFTVVDIKSGFGMLPCTAIQTSAYEMIWKETIQRKKDIDLSFSKEDHLYALKGSVIPSVTKILNATGISDYSMVPLDRLEAASNFGTAVHKACELHDLGTLDERSLDHNLWPYLDAWVSFVKDFDMKFIAIEPPIASTIYRVAGTPDRIAESDKRRRLSVLLGPEGAYKVTEYKDKNDVNVFISALSVYNWRIKNGK